MANPSKILLIDDDDDDQLLFRDLIRGIRHDAECLLADDGLKALVLLEGMDPTPGIIFLDLNMPFIDGFECLARIRIESRLKDIPVVIFTTSSNDADRHKATAQGANRFLTKTADVKSLRNSLRDTLNDLLPA